MSKLIYIDTNVWLDYFLKRDGGFLSPCEVAFQIFSRSVSCEFRILISDALVYELEKYVDMKKISECMKWLEPKLCFVKLSDFEFGEAGGVVFIIQIVFIYFLHESMMQSLYLMTKSYKIWVLFQAKFFKYIPLGVYPFSYCFCSVFFCHLFWFNGSFESCKSPNCLLFSVVF